MTKKKLPWVSTLRRETGLIEHVCEHGVGHPAAASVHWLELHGAKCMGIHGCCGCCQTPEWKQADAVEGYEKANELLKFQIDNFRKLADKYRELLKGASCQKT